MSDPVSTYLQELRDIRSTGAAVKETSYYGTLANLLNEVGKSLKPKVRCIINLANQGNGLPDGGLFTPDQFQRASETEPLPGQLPSRGAIEVKGTGDNIQKIADSDQVDGYWKANGQVLVTNYRDFILLGRDAEGRKTKLEEFRLASSESAFWEAARTPQKLAEEQGERFIEYLKRVMLHAAPLSSPKDVAWFLASYARDAKARIDAKARAAGGELPALANVRTALEQSLGIKFEGDKGEHFFRSTLVQTLFYGVFSAWVLWSKKHPPTDRAARFNWHEAAWSLHVPMIRALFEQVATPSKLGPLGLSEVLDWTGSVLSRVDRATFFERFNEAYAVQYFYEPFLEAFDPVLRKELGVWYTPTEVVKYMVARVDTVLREELDIPDGLADPRVYVLDPCCGTGAYLVEVVRRIHETMTEGGADALVGDDLKHAAMERVFGFEILPAPFVVAHLQMGLLLQNLGAPLADERSERAGVYLTSALTGWEPPDGPKQRLMYPELEEERDAAEKVKRETPILVILGNPPYNGFAGVSPTEEGGLVEPYKVGLNTEWGIKKFNLDDLYVRFFRLAERRIAETTGKGVVCFISNYSYLGDSSYVVMRQRFLSEFDSIWIDCLNGDSRETGKLTPDGKPDPSVFSTDYNREGIQLGTSIGLMVRGETRGRAPKVRFRQFWGSDKRVELLDSLKAKRFNAQYERVDPNRANRLSFRPSDVQAHYYHWPRLTELCAVQPSNGLMEKRGGALIDIDRDLLQLRMRAYFDPRINWEQYKELGHGLTEPQARFIPEDARGKALKAEAFNPERLVRYALRPFETRWCYYTGVRPVWNEPRPSLWAQCWKGNRFLLTRFNASKEPEGSPFFCTTLLSDDHFLAPDAVAIPFQLKNGERLAKREERTLFDVLGEKPEKDEPVANLSTPSRTYLAALGSRDPDHDRPTGDRIWLHVLAIGFSSAYLTENADGIRQDFPRIPLPARKELLAHSAELGRLVSALLDTETQMKGMTSNPIRAELKPIGSVSRVGGGSLGADDLALTVGWGHPGKGGITMPGKGRIVERDYAPDEKEAIRQGAEALSLTLDDALRLLGPNTRDIYLNDIAFWRNVPARVWDYTIGGYQVIKKWLSYRERGMLGRALTPAEAREVRDMIRRIAALILLQPELDANYAAVKANVYNWPSAS
jgi:hypothetical protein